MSVLLVAASITALGSVGLLLRRGRRSRIRQELAQRRQALLEQHAPRLAVRADPLDRRAEFERAGIVRVPAFLAPETLAQLQAEARENLERVERSYVPAHKKGGSLSYEAIHKGAPGCLALYHSPQFQRWLSDLVGERLQPTADHDQSSCSLLYYTQRGDHIGWHYDHNFYRGRHFTVLVSLINRSGDGRLSGGRLQRRYDGAVSVVDTSENTLVIFEGARVLHRATAVHAGDERIMLSMTFCSDPRIGLVKELARRIKDMAYFGPRVLFD